MKEERGKLFKIVTGVVVLVAVAGALVYVAGRMHGTGQPPTNPAIVGTFVSATPNSITIKVQNGSQKTFAISPATKIITQVQSGQIGKTLAQIAAGSDVFVQPHAIGSSVIDSVSILPQPAIPNQNPAGPTVIVSGTLVSTTTNSMILTTADNTTAHITLTKDTVILSNVLAGEQGKTLADAPAGTYMQVLGIAGKDGPTAESVQILLPLGQ